MGSWPSQVWLSVLELEASPALGAAEQGDQPQAADLLCSRCWALVPPVPGTELGRQSCLEGAGMQRGSDGGREAGLTGGRSSLSDNRQAD